MSWKPKGSINGGLRRFSSWFDEFLLEAAKPLAIVGFAMGTVDIFTRGGIAVSPLFNVPWAVVQAITIDGLFFAVWYRIFEGKWSWNKLLLVLIGLVLGVVAMITNGILSLQQLRGTPDSLQAMGWLGIDPITFTIGRAVLVVFVSIMVAFVYHQRTNEGTVEQQQNSVPEQRNSPAEQWNTDWNPLEHDWNKWGAPLFTELVWMEHGGATREQPRTVVVPVVEPSGRESRQLLIAQNSENSDRDKVLSAMSKHVKDSTPYNLVGLAEETGVPYGKVRKLAPGIKKELVL